MFSASKPCVKTEVKQETETVHVKAEKETPKKQSPKKKEVSQSVERLENPLRFSFSPNKTARQNSKNSIGESVDFIIFFKTDIIGRRWWCTVEKEKERNHSTGEKRRFVEYVWWAIFSGSNGCWSIRRNCSHGKSSKRAGHRQEQQKAIDCWCSWWGTEVISCFSVLIIWYFKTMVATR